LFSDVSSYIDKLSKLLMVKFSDNHEEFFVDPYLLYLSGEKDVTNLNFENKHPYLLDMSNTFERSLDSDSYIELLHFDLRSKLMSELLLEFKNLNVIEFTQAVIAKHNSEHVTLSSANLQIEDKEIALSKWGHNTPSPENLKVTPLNNTGFKGQFSTTEDEWKAVWYYLALELDITLRALQYTRLGYDSSKYPELQGCYDYWLERQLNIYFSHEKDSLFLHNNYIKDFTLKGENPMLRELLEDILYVMLNLILAKKISETSANTSIEDCIKSHYEEYSEGYSYLKAIRMYNFNNYTSTEMLNMIGSQR
jgi:hypothetical protein